MKRQIELSFVMLVVVLSIGGCAEPAPAQSEPAPSAEPTAAPVPTDVPTAGPAPTEPSPPTATPSPTEPPPPQALAQSPAGSSLGDTWTRPADEMVMIYVPEGEFEMGSTDAQVDEAFALCYEVDRSCKREYFELEHPTHTVALDGFWIDRTEVTNAQYRHCVEAGACEDPGFMNLDFKNPEKSNHPMVYVHWFEAEGYCQWAGARLPTEAEWEHAARGPERRVFPWGDEFDKTRLNYCDVDCTETWADDSFDDGYAETAPVGSYPHGASWCGALDMAGNVFEWVADWLGEYPSESQHNPPGPPSGEYGMVRGGSQHMPVAATRASFRSQGPFHREATIPDVGIRCAWDAK